MVSVHINTFPESTGVLLGQRAIKDYCMGGRAVVTLKSPTGIHKTYMVRKPRDEASFTSDTRFVYVKGDKSWNYVGMLKGSEFKHTFNSLYPVSSPEFKGAKFLSSMMQRDIDTPMEVFHEGVCARCGRRLVHPESIVRGFGRHCWTLFKHPDLDFKSDESCDELDT